MFKRSKLTQKVLKALLHYRPSTGTFIWRVGRGPVHAGAVAGCIQQGYRVISVFNRLYYAHRLAWLYMTGTWPSDQIDHRNDIHYDNRWKNLRLATHAINQQNQRSAQKNNKLGVQGVSRQWKRYHARIKLNGRDKYLGSFRTPQAAHVAYITAKRQLHPGNTL